MAAAPLKDDEKAPKKPDIEAFITQLLRSKKFEQLADKIAEKAADKIVSLQNSPKYAGRARDDVTPQPTITSTKKVKKYIDKKKEEKDESDSDKQENKSDKISSKEDKSGLDEQEDPSEKPKIDPIAAIKKISEFPVADLSLNFKHFTTREPLKTLKSTSEHKKQKIKENKNEKSQRKHTSKTKLDDAYEVFQRAQPLIQSESQAESDDKKESEESGDSSFDAEKDRKLSKSQETERTRNNKMPEDEKGESESSKSEEKKIGVKTKIQNMQDIKKNESESSESQNDTSISESNENDTKSSLSQLTTLKNSIISEVKVVEKIKSARSDVETTTSPSLTENLIPTGHADTENSRESDENKVSNIADSSKVGGKLKTIKLKAQKHESEIKREGQDLDVKSKDDDDDDGTTDDDEKKNDIDIKKKAVNDNKTQDDAKIDTKKIRESKGKLYAFAQSPDYDEYHEQVANILKSVKDKHTKRNTVNKDLLDLMT